VTLIADTSLGRPPVYKRPLTFGVIDGTRTRDIQDRNLSV
jgi:hypothetical protein